MTFTLSQLQREQLPWVKHNFGDRPAHQPLLGMMEELGEFCLAYGILRNGEGSYEKDLIDAQADILIYMCDFASGIDVNMADIEGALPEELEEDEVPQIVDTVFGLTNYLGQVTHHYLKREQGIRGDASEHHAGMVSNLKGMISALKAISELFDWPFLEKVEGVWAEVKKRDWKKDPNHADKNV